MRFCAPKRTSHLVIILNISQNHFTPDLSFKAGDGLMVDKGFLIEKDVNELGLNLNIPPIAKSNSQMPATDVEMTKKKAKHRVHVERAIAKVKKFKIVSGRMSGLET